MGSPSIPRVSVTVVSSGFLHGNGAIESGGQDSPVAPLSHIDLEHGKVKFGSLMGALKLVRTN